MGNADLRPAFHKTARKGARRRGCERQPARGPPASVLPWWGENTREAQSLTPGRVRGGRRRGRPSARRRHQLCLSALGVTQSQLGCARAYQGFKDLSKRVRSLPRLPTLLFGNSSNSPEVLRSSRKCARNAASGDWLLMGTIPSPRGRNHFQGGMERPTHCSVEATVTSSLPGPKSGGGLAFMETSRHPYYDWACCVCHQGKECSCDMSRAEPQNHMRM